MSSFLRSKVAYMMDSNIVIKESEPYSSYYIQFWTNTLGEGIKYFISPHPPDIKNF